MEITGIVHEVSETRQVTDTFKNRALIVEISENPQYPEFVKFEAVQDKVSILDNANVGDKVTVNFNLKGRAWTNKEGMKQYFNTLQLWKAEFSKMETAFDPAPVKANDVINAGADEEDSLPF